jgi:hypothetical protein
MKYCIYKGTGGLIHMLSGLVYCINYCLKYKNILIIDVISHQCYKQYLSDFFIINCSSLNYSEADGFYEQIEGLIGNIYKQGSLIPRIAMHLDFADYQVRNSFQFRLKIKITFT